MRLWWVTSGAVSLGGDKSVTLETSPLWGLGRTVMQEHPELGCKLVDVEGGAGSVDSVLRELSVGGDEEQVAWRGGRRHVARLVRAPVIEGREARASDGGERAHHGRPWSAGSARGALARAAGSEALGVDGSAGSRDAGSGGGEVGA